MMDACNRPEPPIAGSERETLLSFLSFLRGTIICKLDGLDDAQVRLPHHPSGLTLLGMVKHLATVERYWFQAIFMGDASAVQWNADDPDADWRIEPEESTQDIIDLYRREIRLSDGIINAHAMDDPARGSRPDMDGVLLRWILTHLIEETARHCGHADLMREAIDGQVGE